MVNNEERVVSNNNIRSEDMIFTRAEVKDIDGMLAIENEFFGAYDRKLNRESMMRWINHNPEMFYVVKNSITDEVLASLILVPITKSLYDKLKSGQVSDLFDFQESEVLTNYKSDYFHLESVCSSETRGKSTSIRAARILLGETIRIIYENAKYVTTSPITDKGMKMSEYMGFRKVSEEEHDGQKYSVCELIVTEEKYNKLSSIYGSGKTR